MYKQSVMQGGGSHTLAADISSGQLPAHFYFLGDAAYRGCEKVLTPYIGKVSEGESVFSFYHSSLRMTIECAFGMLVNKWRILDRAIRLLITKTSHVISARMSLYNLIISQNLVHPNAPLIRAPTHSFSRDHHLNARSWVAGTVCSTANDDRVLYDTTDMNNIRNNIM
jgi:hypothetical protein